MELPLQPIELPALLQQFLSVSLFSFVIGLEWHNYRRSNGYDLGYGTTRTLTFVGIAGFVLLGLDNSRTLYLAGFSVLSLFLGIYYYKRFEEEERLLLGPILGLLVYLLAPIMSTFPGWLAVSYVVVILLILGSRPKIRQLSDSLQTNEIITFTKFLLMTGVILPLLPNQQIAPFIKVTFYQVWLAMLVVSGLSYASYLAQTYWLKNRGLLLTALLGGLYSSTATTLVIGRRAQESVPGRQVTQAIILATVMMYLRLTALIAFLGHLTALKIIYPLFVALVASSLLVVFFSHYFDGKTSTAATTPNFSHPLEFKTATLFALLFVVFSAATSYALSNFGEQGLRILSFIVGMTDIDPFILSLLGGDFTIADTSIISAIIIATGSNNLLKAIYSVSFTRNRYTWGAAAWLTLLCLFSLAYAYWLP